MAGDSSYAKSRAVNFNRTQTQYQYFPEEYFTGQDATVYFGDVWVDDLTSLSFGLTENVRPIFGYASRTWDSVARGSRLVQGQFRIAFKEAGYIHTILDHLGQMQAKGKPRLAYLMAGAEEPNWLSGVKENIEDTLTTYHGNPDAKSPVKSETKTVKDLYEWPTLKLNDTDSTKQNTKGRKRDGHTGAVSQLQARLIKLGFTWPTKKFNWTEGGKVPIHPSAKKANGNPTKFYMMRRYDTNNKVIGSGAKYDVSNKEEVELQKRLYEYPGLIAGSMGGTGGKSDGKYGSQTVNAVRKFVKLVNIDDGSNGYWVGAVTKKLLEEGMSVTGKFNPITKLAVMLFQEKNGLTVSGVVDEATKKALSPNTTTTNKTGGESLYKPQSLSDGRFTSYEKEIWGRSFSKNTEHSNRTFFYDETLQLQGWKYLRQHGFDIYINYGPYAENVIKYGGQMETQISGGKVAFNTTVKAIRNVQITDVQMVLDASGNPIEEMYSFIAKDLD